MTELEAYFKSQLTELNHNNVIVVYKSSLAEADKLKVDGATNDYYIKLLDLNGLALKYINDQTDELCLKAVKQNGLALMFVVDQTDEICLEAVKQTVLAYMFVRKITEEIGLIMVRWDNRMIQAIRCDRRTPAICEEAVKNKSVDVDKCHIYDNLIFEGKIISSCKVHKNAPSKIIGKDI